MTRDYRPKKQIALYKPHTADTVIAEQTNNFMRISISLLSAVATIAWFSVGCAGPEQKLGRGMRNVTEFARLGEMQRSIEQTTLWDGNKGFSTGVLRGFSRSAARTGIGLWEVVTFPFPSYDPHIAIKGSLHPDHSIRTYTYPWGGLALSVDPVHPESYLPGRFADSILSPDSKLGFSGGDVAPFIPGSRFRIFED